MDYTRMDCVPPHVGYTGSLVSIGGWLMALLERTQPVVSWLCAVVGLIAGVMTIVMHIKGMRNAPRNKG